MKTIRLLFTCSLFFMATSYAIGQQGTKQNQDKMNTYLIEREIPNAGDLTSQDLKQISQKSCSVLDEMGSSNIQWLHSYVTEDKVYCVYKAKNEELLREHAQKGGFPANKISLMSTTISPKTAEEEIKQ